MTASLALAALYSFVVLGPGGKAVARAIVPAPAASCPSAEVDGSARPMSIRFAGGPGWPITVCEADVSAAKAASIEGKPLALPREKPSRLAALGDTGCRIKQGDRSITAQDCLGGGWPLAKIAQAIAAAKPDLIVHLGDYLYRKASCPPEAASRCGGSPFGPTWAALEADFFAPAAPMFAAAPLVVPRGNHETCAPSKDRLALGGVGYFVLLDPRPLAEVADLARLPAYLEFLAAAGDEEDDDEDGEPPAAACAESTPAYAVPVGKDLDLWVVDSNQPGDTAKSMARHPSLAARYARDFERLQAGSEAAGRRAILLTHRPLYALYPGKRGAANHEPVELNVTLQAAFERAHPVALDLALAGHMHLFQALSFTDGARPPTLTVGSGGTMLDTGFAGFPEVMNPSLRPYRLLGEAARPLAAKGLTAIEFGFLLLTREASGWTRAELRNLAGDTSITCTIEHRVADCSRRHE